MSAVERDCQVRFGCEVGGLPGRRMVEGLDGGMHGDLQKLLLYPSNPNGIGSSRGAGCFENVPSIWITGVTACPPAIHCINVLE